MIESWKIFRCGTTITTIPINGRAFILATRFPIS